MGIPATCWIELPSDFQTTILEEVVDVDAASMTDGEIMEVFGGWLYGAEHGMIKLTPLELLPVTGNLTPPSFFFGIQSVVSDGCPKLVRGLCIELTLSSAKLVYRKDEIDYLGGI